MRNALFVSAFVSVLCPCIGIFLVLRRCSMIGDALSHASLAGVATALLLKLNPITGAFVFASLCGALIEFLRNRFKKHADLVLTAALSLSVGVSVTVISSGRLRAGADSFMFGSALTVTRFDMFAAPALCAASVLTLGLLYHQMLYIAYDEEAAAVAGVRVKLINYVFSVLTAAAISVSVRIVGALALGSLIALPVAAALQLEKGFKATLVFSVVFSAAEIVSGLIFSYYLSVAPGGLTALISVAVLLAVMAAKKFRPPSV